MTVELYDRQETDAAFGALRTIAGALPEPFILLGGWAVYLTAIESYRKEHGAAYLGSRDVDIGFHIDPGLSGKALRRSAFSKAIDAIRKEGYVPIGAFRYCKFVRKETGEVLTEEESKRIPLHDLFYLYIDLMVDRIHPEHCEVFGGKPMDEPALARVFDEGCGLTVELGGAKITIPPPHLLLASKLRSLPARQKDDKTVKDACDIYAILWHSQVEYGRVLRAVRKDFPRECEAALAAITEDVARSAARHLGIDADAYLGVVNGLAGRTGSSTRHPSTPTRTGGNP